jgi:hypothetical protein
MLAKALLRFITPACFFGAFCNTPILDHIRTLLSIRDQHRDPKYFTAICFFFYILSV